MQPVILSIDQGTTNTKAILIDQKGELVSMGACPLDIVHPQSGWVEQSALEIWSSVVSAISRCIEAAPPHEIVSIGISNQRESVVAWDRRTGKPLAPAITWQCRRTTEHTEKLKMAGQQHDVLAKTGLPIDPLFPATKIHWLQHKTKRQDMCTGTVDSWLIWNMTAGERFATDRSNASRTQLLNLQTGQWDSELCNLFDVDYKTLPEVVDSSTHFGTTSKVPGLNDGIPITSAIGDSHAALFGHAAFAPGESKATFGTGSSVMMLTPEYTTPLDGMTSTIAWSIDGKISYALEGNILVSASLFPWAAEILGLGGDVDQLMDIASAVNDSNNVSIVPALTGLGAPHWVPQARGEITGLSFAATRSHIAHAAAMSMPLQVVDVYDAMNKQTRTNATHVYVDGGPTKNHFLMQSLADLLALPVYVGNVAELSALGAGMLAGLQTGFWNDLGEISKLERKREVIQPVMSDDRRQTLLNQWRAAVRYCVDRHRDAVTA